jgi:hypothetical protein
VLAVLAAVAGLVIPSQRKVGLQILAVAVVVALVAEPIEMVVMVDQVSLLLATQTLLQPQRLQQVRQQ